MRKAADGLFRQAACRIKEAQMKKITLMLIIAIIPVALAAAVPYSCGDFFFHGRGFIMWIITLALAILLVYFAYRGVTGQNKFNVTAGGSSEAEAILKIRLAKGELNEDEYERLRSKIQ